MRVNLARFEAKYTHNNNIELKFWLDKDEIRGWLERQLVWHPDIHITTQVPFLELDEKQQQEMVEKNYAQNYASIILNKEELAHLTWPGKRNMTPTVSLAHYVIATFDDGVRLWNAGPGYMHDVFDFTCPWKKEIAPRLFEGEYNLLLDENDMGELKHKYAPYVVVRYKGILENLGMYLPAREHLDFFVSWAENNSDGERVYVNVSLDSNPGVWFPDSYYVWIEKDGKTIGNGGIIWHVKANRYSTHT